jgi:hypothetical protein
MVEETKSRTPTKQMSLFDSREQDVLDTLRSLDVDGLTPIAALNELARLREKLNG